MNVLMTMPRSPARRAALIVGALSALGVLHAQPLAAEEPKAPPDPAAAPAEGLLPQLRFPINDADPASSVPTEEQARNAPLDMGYWVMAVSDRAEQAIKRGEHAKAAKYFAALAKAVPEQAVSFSKICRSLEAAGDRVGALDACRTALGKNGATIDDHVRFAHLLLATHVKLSATDISDLDAIADRLDAGLGAHNVPVIANQLRCELALQLEDQVRLAACVSALQKLAPKDPRTLAFRFAQAVQAKDTAGAGRIIEQARQNGLPAAAIKEMQAALLDNERKAGPWGLGEDGRWLVPLVGAGCGLLAVLAVLLTARRSGARTSRARSS